MYSIILDFKCKEVFNTFGFFDEMVNIDWVEMPDETIEVEAPIVRIIYQEAHNYDDRTWRRIHDSWKIFPYFWFDYIKEEKDVIVYDDNLENSDTKLAGYRLTVIKDKHLKAVIFQRATLLFWNRHYLDKDKIVLQPSGRIKDLKPKYDFAENGKPVNQELAPWKYIHRWSNQNLRRRARIQLANSVGEFLATSISKSLDNSILSRKELKLPFFGSDFYKDNVSKAYRKVTIFIDGFREGWWLCKNNGSYYLAYKFLSSFEEKY